MWLTQPSGWMASAQSLDTTRVRRLELQPNSTMDRRAFIRRAGALVTAGTLAGCSGGEASSGEAGTGENGESGPSVESYLSDVSNFDGTVADRTGQSEVILKVGAEGNGGNFAFAPSAARVATGTKIVWEWTGKGGQHNVVAESGGEFESDFASKAGYTFSQTFDSPGTVLYYCQPHISLGMKGGIIIE